MGSVLSGEDTSVLFSTLLFGLIIAITLVIFRPLSSYFQSVGKRYLRIRLRKWLLDPRSRGSENDAFVSFYRNSLCHLQKINDQLLAKILEANHGCAFFVDRSISFLSSSTRSGGYASVAEFREKVPLTTYDDYRPYVDRMVQHGEKNLLTSGKVIYFATTSGTTGKSKLLPITEPMVKSFFALLRVSNTMVWRSLPTKFPAPTQRFFMLRSGKSPNLFRRSKDGIAIGPLSVLSSAVPSNIILRLFLSTYNAVSQHLIEGINDFETSTFVQLVCALAVPDIFSYGTIFAPGFIHSVKLIEKYVDEITHCIGSATFDHSSLVQNNVSDAKLRENLNQALYELTMEYGGTTYRLERAEHIRNECLKGDASGLLHRLWPNLVFASTAIGSSFATYKDEVKSYCGKDVPLINMGIYVASEGYFGASASIRSDEYFLSPTAAFFEFIKEEDIDQVQPKTLLISEIRPGNRYEVVITTEAGLVRYRLGDVITCTRLLSRADDLVPLPSEPVEIPRIPLISVAYRVGTLLNIAGEKTSEQHLLYALQQTIQDWRNDGILIELADFSSFPKLDAFPPHYVILLELLDVTENKINHQQIETLKRDSNLQIERYLCKANDFYQTMRNAGKLGPLHCLLVRSGTFWTFRQNLLAAGTASPLQIKPQRLLRSEEHMRFFYESEIDTSIYQT